MAHGACRTGLVQRSGDVCLLVEHEEDQAQRRGGGVHGYRSLEGQEALFFARYDLIDYGRVPQITRQYKGRTYFLKPGMSPSASPGTSPHGWACAQDFDVSGGAYDWLCKNGPKYGAYLQGPPSYLGRPNPEYEAWHWQISDPENPTRKVRRAWRKFLKALGGQ